MFRLFRRRRSGAFSYSFWARRLCRRLAAALLVSLLLPILEAPLLAQDTTTLHSCIEGELPGTGFNAGEGMDPAATAPRQTVPAAPQGLVLGAVECAMQFADQQMVPIGRNIWGGLALIIIVWTGIQMMFSGGFGIGEIISLILLLGFPFALLEFYNSEVATPWGDMEFPYMVSGMGQVVSEQLVEGAFDSFAGTIADVFGALWARETFNSTLAEVTHGAGETGFLGWLWGAATASASEVFEGWFGWVMGLAEAVFRSIGFLFVVALVIVLMVLPALVAYCAYLWGYLALMVSIILGPLLIPWFLVPQLQFLAWGWFRSLLGAGVQMMVGGAVFAAAVQILSIPLIRFHGMVGMMGNDPYVDAVQTHPTGIVFAVLGPLVVALIACVVENLPLILLAWVAVFKVGEITSLIVNGGPMPQSGSGGHMRGPGTMGRAAGGAGAPGGGGAMTAAGGVLPGAGAVLAARTVMSQSTR